MRVITIMADYGGAWAWVRETTTGGIGPNIASDDFWGGDEDIPQDLLWKFKEWQRIFDVTSIFDLKKSSSRFDWVQFHQRGLELAQELRQYLPQDVRLFYEKPYEDPEYYAFGWECPDWLVEIHSGCKTRSIVSPEEMLSIRLVESDDSPRLIEDVKRRVIVHLDPEWGWCWIGREKQTGFGVLIGSENFWEGPMHLPEEIFRIARGWFAEYKNGYLKDMFNWEESHEKGLEITRQVRGILPTNISLYYIRASEDPCYNPGRTYSDCPESLLKYDINGDVTRLFSFNDV